MLRVTRLILYQYVNPIGKISSSCALTVQHALFKPAYQSLHLTVRCAKAPSRIDFCRNAQEVICFEIIHRTQMRVSSITFHRRHMSEYFF